MRAQKKRGTRFVFSQQARPSFKKPVLFIVLATTSSPILAAIEKHQEAISLNVRYRKRCLRCDATQGFKKHELRRRKLRVIVSLTVQVLSIVLVRWKCQRCGLVFTDSPDFRTSLPTLRQHQPPAASPRVSGV